MSSTSLRIFGVISDDSSTLASLNVPDAGVFICTWSLCPLSYLSGSFRRCGGPRVVGVMSCIFAELPRQTPQPPTVPST